MSSTSTIKSGDKGSENAPSAKRKRTDEPDEGKNSEIRNSFVLWEQGEVSLAKIDGLVDAVVEQLHLLKDKRLASAQEDSTTSGINSHTQDILRFASCGLLQLRAWQRDLLQQCSSLDESSQKMSRIKYRQEQALASLQYEKEHLKEQIATVTTFNMPYLEKVLQKQNGERNQEESAVTTEGSIGHTLMVSDLDTNSPGHRTAILQHLQDEIQKRSALEKKRDELQQKLKAVKQEFEKQRDILNHQLPKYLVSLEQASKPLQQWFSLPCIGTERNDRLKMAQHLPSPLYTLFVCLQEYLDLLQMQHDAGHRDASDYPLMSIGVVPTIGVSSTPTQPYEVQWTLPVPEIAAEGAIFHSNNNNSSNRKPTKKVTIHFQHVAPEIKTGPRCIRTTVSGCSGSLDQTFLLAHLFPNDDIQKEDYKLEKENSNNSIGQKVNNQFFYCWSHHLAGLHLVPPPTMATSKTETTCPNMTTVEAIVKTLQRRIRANATLKHILLSLQKHKIPNLPTASEGDNEGASAWQLVSFTLLPQSHKGESVFTYDVHCRNKSTRLDVRAKVEIDKARYPNAVPKWSVTMQESIQNVSWKLLERTLNEELPNSWTKDNADNVKKIDQNNCDELAEESSLLFAEWILIHQFHKLLQKWEEVVIATTTTMATTTDGARAVRGRDRVLTSLSKL